MTPITEREHLLMEAAQCVWEEIDSEMRNMTPYWEKQRQSNGCSGLRYYARCCAPFVLEAYDYAMTNRDELVMSYDWEFVPFVVNNLIKQIDIPCSQEPTIHEDWKKRLDAFLWKTELQDLAQQHYGLTIEDVMSDPDNPPLDQTPAHYLTYVAVSKGLERIR